MSDIKYLATSSRGNKVYLHDDERLTIRVEFDDKKVIDEAFCIHSRHELETKDVDGNIIKLRVSIDVIDFLELHTIENDNGIKYYIVNDIKYKYNGVKDNFIHKNE